MVEKAKDAVNLTEALEDYLETIFNHVRKSNFARIRDIAEERNVTSASVIPAMKRLDDLGLIKYEKREYITLTEEGKNLARAIFAKHQLMQRFFDEVLSISPETAEKDACAMEHHLSSESMDALARFFEYLQVCPEARKLLDKFQNCSFIHDGRRQCDQQCVAKKLRIERDKSLTTVADLKPGESGIIARISGKGAIRQRLLEMGLMPSVNIELERIAPAGDPIWIRLHNFQVSLRKKEAAFIWITKY